MIAKPYWDYSPEVSILDSKDSAVIEVDMEMLDGIMHLMRESVKYKINNGQYDDALEMLQSYRKLEDMQIAWMSKSEEECDENIG